MICDVYAKNAKNICLVETWLDPKKETQHDFPKKKLIEASKGRGRGCCVITALDTGILSQSVQDTFQHISFKLTDEIQVTCMYLSSLPSKSDFSVVTTVIKNVLRRNFSQVIIGDFNFEPGETNHLSAYLKSIGLLQMVKEPTQIEGRIIDHVYISPKLQGNIDVQIYYPHLIFERQKR